MGRAAAGWKLRKRKNSPFWRVYFTLAGRRFERSTRERRKAAAARVAREIYAEEEKATRHKATGPEGEALDLTTAIGAWLEALINIGKSDHWKNTLRDYGAFWKACSDLWPTVADITDETVAIYINDRLGEVDPTTVRKELSGLRRFLKWCKTHKHIDRMPEWEPPELGAGTGYEARCLKPEEFAALLTELPERGRKREPIRAYFLFQWATAFRRGTMERLRWADIDLDARMIKIRAAADKRKYARPAPMTADAVAALAGLEQQDELIWGPTCRYTESLRNAAKRAGLDPKGIHDRCIRHSAITHAASYTRDLLALMHFAGHQRMETTSRYLHHNEDRTREMLANRPSIVALSVAPKKKPAPKDRLSCRCERGDSNPHTREGTGT